MLKKLKVLLLSILKKDWYRLPSEDEVKDDVSKSCSRSCKYVIATRVAERKGQVVQEWCQQDVGCAGRTQNKCGTGRAPNVSALASVKRLRVLGMSSRRSSGGDRPFPRQVGAR